MTAILLTLWLFVVDLFKSRSRLEAENLFLRHQLNIALRRAPSRVRLSGSDRALLVLMTKLWPNLVGMARLVQPETILRWHRTGFRVFWRWKSRNRAGRPKIDRGLRDLIRRISTENPLWGASRIHGELLMLGFEVAQSTVSKYMVRRRKPPSQSWKTFLRNHGEAISAIDMCVVPTVTFELLFAFLVLGHGRRHLLWFEVARHPTAEWLARTNHRGFPVGISADLPGARQRPCLWTGLPAPGQGHGYPRQANFPELTLAKWDCGASDRHRAPRVPRPNASFWRSPPPAHSLRLCDVLQSSAHAHSVTEGCSFTSGDPAKRNHYRHARSVGSSSSVWADMNFGKDRQSIWVGMLAGGAAAGIAGMIEAAGPLGQLSPQISPGTALPPSSSRSSAASIRSALS